MADRRLTAEDLAGIYNIDVRVIHALRPHLEGGEWTQPGRTYFYSQVAIEAQLLDKNLIKESSPGKFEAVQYMEVSDLESLLGASVADLTVAYPSLPGVDVSHPKADEQYRRIEVNAIGDLLQNVIDEYGEMDLAAMQDFLTHKLADVDAVGAETVTLGQAVEMTGLDSDSVKDLFTDLNEKATGKRQFVMSEIQNYVDVGAGLETPSFLTYQSALDLFETAGFKESDLRQMLSGLGEGPEFAFKGKGTLGVSSGWNILEDYARDYLDDLEQRPETMTSTEAAEQLGLSSSQVSKLIAEEAFEAEKVGGRWQINLDSFTAYSQGLSEAGGEVEGVFDTGYTYSTADAADYLGVSTGTITSMISAGTLDAHKVGNAWQVSVDSLALASEGLAPSDVMSTAEAAEQLGVSSTDVLGLIASGDIQGEKVGGRWKIDYESFTAYSQSLHEQKPVEGVFGTGYTYSIKQAASFLGVSESRVMGMIGDRSLDASKEGNRWQVSVDSLSVMVETLGKQPDTMGKADILEQYSLTDSQFQKLVGPGGAWHDPGREKGDPYQVPTSTLKDWETGPEGTEFMIGAGKAQGPVEQVLGSADVRKIFGWSQSKLDRHVETGMLYREKDESGKWRYFLDERSMFQLPEDWQEKLEGVEEGKPTSGIPADSLPEFIIGGIMGAGPEQERWYSGGEVVDYLMKERRYSRKSAENIIAQGYLGLESTETGMWLKPGANLYEDLSQYTADEGPGMVTQPVEFGRVVDGDTITLSSGESVRYLGMDAPELGERGWTEYRKANEEFFKEFGDEINVEWTRMWDQYGRPLAYVTNAAGLSATDYINQRMAEGTQDVAQPDYMLDMLFKRLYQATRTGDMELAQNTAQEISASGASPEEFHTRGFAAPGESTGPAAASPKGTAFKELRTINEFIDQGYTYSLINRYKELKSSTNPKDEVERERISGLLSDKGINAEEAVTGKADRSWWDIDFWSVPEETPGMEIYGPQPEDLLKFDQPGKGTGEGLYISDTVNFERWLDASSAGDDFNRKRIEKEWRDADIQDPYQRFTDEQIQLASESESVQGWLAEQQGIDRGTIYDPLDREWWAFYIPSADEETRRRLSEGDYTVIGELKSVGPKVAITAVSFALYKIGKKFGIVKGPTSWFGTLRSAAFSLLGLQNAYQAGKSKGVETLLNEIGITDKAAQREISELMSQIEGMEIPEGTRLIDPVSGEVFDFSSTRTPTVSDLTGEGVFPVGTFWEQDFMRIEEITRTIEAGGYVSQSDVSVLEKYAADAEWSAQWKRSRGTDLSDILGQAQDVMTEAPPVSAVTDMPAGLSEATPDDLQRLADWQGKPYGAALRFEPTDIADASDYVTYARSKGAVWAKDSPEILDFMSAPGLYEPPDWLKAYIVARREAGVTTEWAEPNRLYAQVQSGEDILSVNKMTGEVFGLPDVPTGAADDIAIRPSELGFTDEIADIGADLDALPSAWDDAAKVPSLDDINKASRYMEMDPAKITAETVQGMGEKTLKVISDAAARGGSKAGRVWKKILDVGSGIIDEYDFGLMILIEEPADVRRAIEAGQPLPHGYKIIGTSDEPGPWFDSIFVSATQKTYGDVLPGSGLPTGLPGYQQTPILTGESQYMVAAPEWAWKNMMSQSGVDLSKIGEQPAGMDFDQWIDYELTQQQLGQPGFGLTPGFQTQPPDEGPPVVFEIPGYEPRPTGQGHKEGMFVAEMPEWVSELLTEHPLPPQADIPVTIPGAQEMVVLDFGPESFAFQGPVTPGFDPVPIGAMGADTIQDQLLPTPEYPGISQGIPQVDFSQFGFHQTAEMKWEPDPNTWVEVDVSAGDLYKDWRKGQPTLSIGQHTYSLRQGKLQGLREQVGGMGDPLLGRLWEALQGRYGEGGFTAGQYSSWLGYVTHLRSWRVNFDNE